MTWEILQNSQKKHLCRNLFFDQVKFCRSGTLLKTSLWRKVFFCEICEICSNTFLVEHHQTTASDYSSMNSREERIGKRNLKLRYKDWSICTNLSRKCKLLKMAIQVKEQVSDAVVCRLQIRGDDTHITSDGGGWGRWEL